MMLFRRAKSGAKGKEATKSVTIPNWITIRNDKEIKKAHIMNSILIFFFR